MRAPWYTAIAVAASPASSRSPTGRSSGAPRKLFREIPISTGRPDNSRVHELVRAFGRYEQLGVLELDGDRVAGKHVGDVHREHVGAAFLQQRCALPIALCFFELARRLLALLDSGHNAYVADGHRHAVDRCPRRRRKNIAGMKRPLAAILVQLSDGDVRNHTGNRDVDPRVLQRQSIDGWISTVDEEEGRERLVSRRSIVLRRG